MEAPATKQCGRCYRMKPLAEFVGRRGQECKFCQPCRDQSNASHARKRREDAENRARGNEQPRKKAKAEDEAKAEAGAAQEDQRPPVAARASTNLPPVVSLMELGAMAPARAAAPARAVLARPGTEQLPRWPSNSTPVEFLGGLRTSANTQVHQPVLDPGWTAPEFIQEWDNSDDAQMRQPSVQDSGWPTQAGASLPESGPTSSAVVQAGEETPASQEEYRAAIELSRELTRGWRM
ncbi:hypothetical protein N7468_002112 [Penicillium chermesinum]|uniref:Uncharacterized protein n=1 Tax=Penicillium chermesinum TaxID=63820 RepID=A0A9W9PHW3_9EURO|nr:uncharacterized protein N7468_002112 [Penicillium chermesinum]KAJ5247129.1 hypothetical protein N7468_002112 [Penicillium chermesinum]